MEKYGFWKSGCLSFFLRFSSEDSGQTGKATGEPRVASHSWSCSLSEGSKLVDQLTASRKESAREGSCPGGKTHQIFSAFSLFSSVFACTVDVAPDVGFRSSWCLWKACATFFLKAMDLREVELGLERYSPTNRGRRSVFGSSEDIFPIKIPSRPGKILAIRELHVMSEHVLSLKVIDLWITLQRVGKNLCASAASSGGKL